MFGIWLSNCDLIAVFETTETNEHLITNLVSLQTFLKMAQPATKNMPATILIQPLPQGVAIFEVVLQKDGERKRKALALASSRTSYVFSSHNRTSDAVTNILQEHCEKTGAKYYRKP